MSRAERESRRVAERRAQTERARRKLLPVMVAACEVYGVTPDDILSRSVHPDVLAARDVVELLGWQRCKIGPGILSDLLKKSRPEISKKLVRLRAAARFDPDFQRAVDLVLRRMAKTDAAAEQERGRGR